MGKVSNIVVTIGNTMVTIGNQLVKFFQILIDEGPAGITDATKRFVRIRKYRLFQIFLMVVSVFVPKKGSLWSFSSLYGFSENPKYVFLYAEHSVPDVDPVWFSDDKEMVNELRNNGFESYHMWSVMGVYKQLRSKFSFTSHMQDNQHWGAFRKGSIRTCLLHGNQIVGNLHRDSSELTWYNEMKKDVDYVLLSGSKKPRELYETTRPKWYLNSVPLPLGYPKNDPLLEYVEDESIGCDLDLINEVEHRSKNEQIIFYVPTKVGKAMNPLLDSETNLQNINEFLADKDAHMYIKLHPNELYDPNSIGSGLENITIYDNNIDVYPLLRSTDIFISDYTSTIIDVHLKDIPIIYFAYDKRDAADQIQKLEDGGTIESSEDVFDKYGYTRRGSLVIDYDEIFAGHRVLNTDELIEAIRSSLTDPNQFEQERNSVKELYFDEYDSNSAQRVTEFFLTNYLHD